MDYELVQLLNRPDSVNSVIALPPSGLMGGYLRVLKKVRGTTVVIKDKPESLLERTTFYDIDSRPIEKELTPKEMKLYLNEIKKDITYFSVKMTSGDFDCGKSSDRSHLETLAAGFLIPGVCIEHRHMPVSGELSTCRPAGRYFRSGHTAGGLEDHKGRQGI